MIPVARALRERSAELSAGMTERIGAELPELIGDPDDAETNRASNEANLLLIADLLERGADPASLDLPPQTLAFARVGAHQNAPLPGLMRIYRIGHAYGWQQILGMLREIVTDPDDFAQAVDLVSAWLHEFIDAAVCLGEEAYNREREVWVRTSSALRAETIREILSGAPIERAAASQRLGYELDRHHLGLVGWVTGEEQAMDPLAAIERELGRVAVELGGGTPLVHPMGLSVAAGWIGAGEGLGPAAIASISSSDGGVRVAVGEPGAGIEGFERTHREAMQARRVAMLSGAAAGSTTLFSDVALAAITTTEPEMAEEFVHRHLGALADAGEVSARLAVTLGAYLDAGGSPGRAAAALGVHENTVRYRVRQAEDLLGRPIGPEDLDLRVSLAMEATTRGFGEV